MSHTHTHLDTSFTPQIHTNNNINNIQLLPIEFCFIFYSNPASLLHCFDILGNFDNLSRNILPLAALLGILLRLHLLLLNLLQSICLGLGPHRTTLALPLLELLDINTDKGPLDLGDLPGTLLSDNVGQALFVADAPRLGPHQFGGLLVLHCEGSGLGRAEPQGLSITADEELAISGVDAVAAEVTEFCFDDHVERFTVKLKWCVFF